MIPQNKAVTASPFFAPSTPRVLRPISTPGGTFVRMEKKEVDKESKSSVVGTSGNLINAIVGAGIVGIPYAMRESGLVAGIFMVILCAFLTDKSLRLLIETAKHIDVPSYEVLAEASFGKAGFYFISINMFIMAYGAMISYLMIIKDTLPPLLGIAVENYPVRRAILVVTSFLIIFPISCQRDMADLAKTSSISVIFDCFMVFIVATHAPVSDNIYDFQSAMTFIQSSIIRPRTFFTGLGVLSFAFVCQHSGFIIAGSLKNPTRKRWSRVTSGALVVCGILASMIGLTAYVGFGDRTDGNILNNFVAPATNNIANLARGFLCTTMFFVYPMESFVARHVLVATCFQGRRAHEGDDHAVLARWDRRVGVTLFLYICALIPAVLFEDLGPVLAVTGAIGGSSLSYIGTGASYLAIHGAELLKVVEKEWPHRRKATATSKDTDVEKAANDQDKETAEDEGSFLSQAIHCFMWYACLMPLWCKVCEMGEKQLEFFREQESLKSPHPNRLGKVIHQNPIHKPPLRLNKQINGDDLDDEYEKRPLVRPPVRRGSFDERYKFNNTDMEKFIVPPYGSTPGAKPKAMSNKEIAKSIAEKNRLKIQAEKNEVDSSDTEEEDDPQDVFPTWADFVIAVGYIVFGIIALSAGLVSIFANGDEE